MAGSSRGPWGPGLRGGAGVTPQLGPGQSEDQPGPCGFSARGGPSGHSPASRGHRQRCREGLRPQRADQRPLWPRAWQEQGGYLPHGAPGTRRAVTGGAGRVGLAGPPPAPRPHRVCQARPGSGCPLVDGSSTGSRPHRCQEPATSSQLRSAARRPHGERGKQAGIRAQGPVPLRPPTLSCRFVGSKTRASTTPTPHTLTRPGPVCPRRASPERPGCDGRLAPLAPPSADRQRALRSVAPPAGVSDF